MDYKNKSFVGSQDASSFAPEPGVERKVMSYCDELMCVEINFRAGASGAMHEHPHTQVTYVAEGVFEFTIGGQKKTVRKGDTLLMRRSVPHGCVCLEKGILVDVFTPMRGDFV